MAYPIVCQRNRAAAVLCGGAASLILLDIGLPGSSGYEVAREVRMQPRGVERV